MTDEDEPPNPPPTADGDVPEDSWALMPGAKRAIANQIAQIVLAWNQDRRCAEHEPRIRIAAAQAAVAIGRQHLAEQRAARNDGQRKLTAEEERAELDRLARQLEDWRLAEEAVQGETADCEHSAASSSPRADESRGPGDDRVGE